ncbi:MULTISPECIES: AIPR family protein [Pseudomonas]|uniref:AIPR family protein n=1 Tax=Pseudomonas TaxID=286 RepID=UPI0004295E07|nr:MULTISPECIES: AIPR family protein [Pseudomonas]POA64166.1 abortive phage infection protein [Pseudomonas sp. GW531-T4]
MHIIIERNIEELVKEFEYDKKVGESKLFEYFCNYCTTSKHYLGRFDPVDITTEEDDASIDGISIIIDGDLITTIDDAKKIFSTHKTNLTADIIFTQCKSGEQFKKAEINNFSVGIEDFLSLDPELPQGKLNVNSLKIFNEIISNLRKLKNRLPNFHAYYCTSGHYKSEREIKASFELLRKKVTATDLFFDIQVVPVGRVELLKLYANATEKNEATLKLIDYFGMPKIPNIPQSYIAIANANEFVKKVLLDSDGNLNHRVFEENVRSFLGLTNDVNGKIQATLKDDSKKDLFSVLNNGITIVAPELTLTPNTKEINLTNYQIINGCQTSNTLFLNKELLGDSVNIVIKFIESANNDVSEDIIAATNNQTEVQTESFHGLKSKAKLVQKYFDAQNSKAAPENKIYFERRENEYKDSGYQFTRKFDVRELARCYAAMLLNQPHNSARYVKAIFTTSGKDLFCDSDHESLYYASALALYKYNTLVNGRKIGAQNFITLRWHIIQVFKWVVHGKTEMPVPGSKAADAYAKKIITSLTSDKKPYVNQFEVCQQIIKDTGKPSTDALKRGKFTSDLLNKANEYFANQAKNKP